MPTHKRLGTDDRENLRDGREPLIQLDEEPPIIVREPDPALYNSYFGGLTVLIHFLRFKKNKIAPKGKETVKITGL
jgi:hypothetical protein